MKSVIIVNITWNPNGWREIYINPKAGHRYAKEHPGHETLNFKFDKKRLDTEKRIYGYVQWTYPPKDFTDGGIVLFYSKNLELNKGQIVGIYCDTKIYTSAIKTNYKGLENDELLSNLEASKNISMLFPIFLDANNYSDERLVPQVGFTYKDEKFAEQIIKDEINELKKSNIKLEDFKKLSDIYYYITGKKLSIDKNDEFFEDIKEQDELVEVISKESDENHIKNDLRNLKATDPEEIILKQKTYKRDNKTIAQLKILRQFKCQICNAQIKIKNNKFYIEAAHIIPKSKKGNELPENILILCPNHHKEFDLSEKKIIEHTKEKIIFEMNNKKYEVILKI